VGWYLLIPPVFRAMGDHPRAFNDLNASFMIAALAQAALGAVREQQLEPGIAEEADGRRR